MIRTKPCLLALGLALSLVACGGSKPPASAPPPPDAKKADADDGTFRAITQGQLKIAHYATGDGMVGLVFDRSGTRAKVKIDGDKDVIELTPEEDRHGDRRRGWYMKAPDGKNVLYLQASGGLQVFRGNDLLSVNSDKAAQPLPQATVAGEYKRPKSNYDKSVEALTPLALRTRNASFKPEDSGNLPRVADAFAAATPDMLVHITDLGATHARFAPSSRHIGNEFQGLGGEVANGPSDDPWDKSKGGLAKYGAQLVPMHVEYDSPNRLRMYTLKGYSKDLPSGTPGIIFDVDDGTVVFLTMDGGRYELSVTDGDVVAKGATPAASWPAPLQHTLLDVDGIRALAKGKAVPEKLGKDIEAADDAWFECINDQWKKAKSDMDKTEASHASANDKWGKLGGIRKSAELAAPKTCEPKKKELDAALVKVIEARAAERLALLEKNKAKFK